MHMHARTHTQGLGGISAVEVVSALMLLAPVGWLTLGSSPFEDGLCTRWSLEGGAGGGRRNVRRDIGGAGAMEKGKEGGTRTCLTCCVTLSPLCPSLGSAPQHMGLKTSSVLAVMGDLGGHLSTLHFPIPVPKRGSVGPGEPGGAHCDKLLFKESEKKVTRF